MVCPPLLQVFVPSWLKIAPSTTRHDIHIAALIRLLPKSLPRPLVHLAWVNRASIE